MTRLPIFAGLVLTTIVFHLVLIQPNHPAAMTLDALKLFPLELPVLIALFVALPHRNAFTYALRALLVLVLTLVAVLKVADYGMAIAFNRTFNPLVDIHLVEAGLRLLAGTIGQVPATVAAVGAGLAPFILATLLWWSAGRWLRVEPPRGVRVLAVLVALAGTGLAVAEIGQARRAWALPFDPPGAAFTARVALERSVAYRGMFADLEAFRVAAETDVLAGATELLDRLEGRDVVLTYVESYGRTSIDNPLYASTHVPTLEAAETALAEAGLGVRTGYLTSPIAGGQSWLAHGSLASGLSTGNQARYSAMLASPRRTLFTLASDAGYRVAAVMPAIVLPWPEAGMLGIPEVFNAERLDYRGEPFNWVTMPDQFTLTAFDRLLGDSAEPIFVQIALISSHAPWTPVPSLIDWDAVGDGSEFDAMAKSGESPQVVWANQDSVRDHYRMTIDYSLQTVFEHTARTAEAGRLTIVLGDHPPAAFVNQIDSRDVPVHVIGPPEVLAAIDAWGFTESLVPDATTPVWPMEAFRDRFVTAYTTSLAP